VNFNGITSIPNFVKICQMVQTRKWRATRHAPYGRANCSGVMFRMPCGERLARFNCRHYSFYGYRTSIGCNQMITPRHSSGGPGSILGSGQVGLVVDKVALGQVFSEYFGFPCQSSFHQLLHNHPHLSSGAGTIGQKWEK
jgi:hypothetical protein